MKKLLLGFTILMMVILTACGGGNNAQQTNTGENNNKSSNESSDEKFTFKFASLHPTTNPLVIDYQQVFIDRVHELTGGQVKIEFYPSEQLGKADQMLDLLKSGVADFAVLVPSYYSDKLPLSNVMDLPGVYSNSIEGTSIIKKLLKENKQLMDEYSKHQVQPLAVAVLNPNPIFTVSKRITSLDDLKGLRISVAGGTTELIMQTLGATPVRMPSTEVYTAIERNTVDGNMFVMSAWKTYQVDEFAKYSIGNYRFGGGGQVAIGMRDAAFDKLPENIKEAITQAGEDAMESYSTKATANEEALIKEYKEKGIEFYELSDDQIAAIDDRLKAVHDKWLDNMEKINLDGQGVLDTTLKIKEELK